MTTRSLTLAVVAAAVTSPALGQSEAPAGVPSPDATDLVRFKAPFTLANPTPRDLWRPLAADRPDATESPITVDAGAVQVELSFVEYTYNDAGGEETNTFAVAPINLKIGLTNRADIQFVFAPYVHSSTSGGTDSDGVGDLEVRLKVNLWGNDGGTTAFGFLPFITLPTGSDDVGVSEIEGGFFTPFSLDLAEFGLEGWGLGAQAGFIFERNDADNGYDTRFQHTTVLGYELTERIGVFGEFIGETVIGESGYSPGLSGGMTYSVNEDVQLDAGVVMGLDDDSTDDLTMFGGVTSRF